MKINLLICLFLLTSYISFSQNSETIISSRPGQAFVPDVLGKGFYQLQSGFNYSKSETGDPGIANSKILQYNNLLRYGLSRKIDFRASITLSRETLNVDNFPEATGFGINDIELGIRYNFLDGNKAPDKLAVQADFGLPIRPGDFSSELLSYDFLVIYSRPLFGPFSLTANVGLQTFDIGVGPIAKYVLNVGFPISDELSAFVEIYGNYERRTIDELNVLFDGGFAFLVNNDLQLDLSFGYSGDATNSIIPVRQWFLDGGVSIRFR